MTTGCCLTEHLCLTPEETETQGENLARILKPGSVVALRGGLGAGKTCFVKGIARGLGIPECITSPTYTIICEYRTENNIPFYHMDVYRLNGDEGFESTGALELMNGNGITVIEWSERIQNSIPSDAIIVEIEIAETNCRIIRVNNVTILL